MTFAFGIDDLDADYGRMRAFYESWTAEEEDITYTEIQTRNCTDADFGFGGQKSANKRFFDPD